MQFFAAAKKERKREAPTHQPRATRVQRGFAVCVRRARKRKEARAQSADAAAAAAAAAAADSAHTVGQREHVGAKTVDDERPLRLGEAARGEKDGHL